MAAGNNSPSTASRAPFPVSAATTSTMRAAEATRARFTARRPSRRSQGVSEAHTSWPRRAAATAPATAAAPAGPDSLTRPGSRPPPAIWPPTVGPPPALARPTPASGRAGDGAARNPRASRAARARAAAPSVAPTPSWEPVATARASTSGPASSGKATGHRAARQPAGHRFRRRPGHGQHHPAGDGGDEAGPDAEGLGGDLQRAQQRPGPPGQRGDHPERQERSSRQHAGAGPAPLALGDAQARPGHVHAAR